MNWEQLVQERNEWVAHNFPDSKLDEPMDESLVGVIEETGELAHAHLKAAQGIRGPIDKHIGDAVDAIGDCTIYLLGVISHLNLKFEDEGIRPNPVFSSPTWALKTLAYHVGKLQLSPSGHDCYRIVECLIAYCNMQDWDYEEIVMCTWARVKQRDWQKNREDGGATERAEPCEAPEA